MRLDLTSLEAFRVVAREGGVSRAADKLNRVQSNISTRIRQLERQLGTTLFIRQNRRMTLTDAGRSLLPYADRMLTLSREAADAVQTERLTGPFRIGAMESTAAARLPQVLSAFHTRHPEVSVHLTTGTAGALLGQLDREEIDIAFVAEPVPKERLTSLPVFEEALCLVGSGLANITDETGELDGQVLVAFEEGCAYRRYLHEWLLENGVTPGSTMSVGSYLAILACVSAGTGIAVVPKSVLAIIDVHNTLHARALPGRYSRIKTLMIWRSGFRSPKLDALRELLTGGTP